MNNDTAIMFAMAALGEVLADRQREIDALREALNAAEAEAARVGQLLAQRDLQT